MNSSFFKKIVALKDNPQIQELFVYGIFGVLTTLVNLICFQLLLWFFPQLNKDIRNIISIIIAILFAYVTNRKYVFKSTEKNVFKEFTVFLGSRGFSALFEIACFHICAESFHLEEMLSKLITAFFVIIINYICSKLFVFKKHTSS